jgi:hypothetical protein
MGWKSQYCFCFKVGFWVYYGVKNEVKASLNLLFYRIYGRP